MQSPTYCNIIITTLLGTKVKGDIFRNGIVAVTSYLHPTCMAGGQWGVRFSRARSDSVTEIKYAQRK